MKTLRKLLLVACAAFFFAEFNLQMQQNSD